MGPLREITGGQVVIEKNSIPACFAGVQPITSRLFRDDEQEQQQKSGSRWRANK